MADSPLNDDDLIRINSNLDQLTAAEDAIKLAKTAGIDVERFENTARDQRAQLLKIKQTYFPGK